MATLTALFCSFGSLHAPGAGIPFLRVDAAQTEVIATGIASTVSTLASAEEKDRGALELLVEGGAVWVTIGGAAPVAVVGQGVKLLAGDRKAFVVDKGDKFAVINA